MDADSAPRSGNRDARSGVKAGVKLHGTCIWQIVLAVHVFEVSPRRVYDGLHYDV